MGTLPEVDNYLWLLLPLLALGAFMVLIEVLRRRAIFFHSLRVALYLLGISLAFELSLWQMPPAWGQSLAPYGRALYIFTGLVFLIHITDGLLIGYFLGRIKKRHVPPILRKAGILTAYFISAMVILRSCLNLDVTSLVATSAVVSFVVGLASQDLLGSILAGIVIGVERPIVRDNWIHINDLEGRVVDITWRRTLLKTRDGDFVLLPNSEVMKKTILNHTLPDKLHRVTLKVGVHYRHPPNQVKNAMMAAASHCPYVLASPEPSVFLEEFGDSSINYRLNAWIRAYDKLEQIRDQINTHIWYQFKRRGIEIPFPIRTVVRPRPQKAPQEAMEEKIKRIMPLLEKTPFFETVPSDELWEIARRLKMGSYGAGEVLVRQGASGRSMFMIISGKAKVLAGTGAGQKHLVARLDRGDIFGEMSLLLGQPRNATVQLEEDSELIEFSPGLFKDMIERHSGLLEHLSALVESRQSENTELKAMFAREKIKTKEGRVSAILGRIKRVFGVL